VNEKATAKDLKEAWEGVLKRRDEEKLTGFLVENSNLPGPRANLMLAMELGKLVSNSWDGHSEFLKKCINAWTKDEYLRTCRNITLGYIMAEHPEEDEWIARILYEDNFSEGWRPREAVTIGLCRALERRPDDTLALLEKWNKKGDLTVLRNTLVALADPHNLKENEKIRDSLRLYTILAMDAIKNEKETKSKGYDILKKSLGFTVSVAAVEDPKMMQLLDTWVDSDTRPWKNILRSNLKKSRLIKKYPEWTMSLQGRLN
jgi:hypothetical protein